HRNLWGGIVNFGQERELELRLQAAIDAKREIYQSVKKEYEFCLAQTRDLVGVNRDGSLAFAHLRRVESSHKQALEEYKTAVADFNRFVLDRLGLQRCLDMGDG